MIRLILLRHGNTFEAGEVSKIVGAQTDLSLTTQGIEQARLAATQFSIEKISPKAIFSGHLKRQRKTAQILHQQFPLATLIDEQHALTEIDYGAWEGLSESELIQYSPQEWRAWVEEAKWPAAIFHQSQEERIIAIQKWLEHLKSSYQSGDEVIAVTSNGIMRIFYSLFSKDWAQIVEKKEIETRKVKTGHFCELHIAHNRVHIERWNQKPMA